MSSSSHSPDPAPFADVPALLRNALQAYLPPPRITVAEHAGRHRWLDNRGGGYVGRWNHEEAPYLVEPMEALTSQKYLTVAVAGPARSGKTAIGENWILQSVDTDPADMLWYEPTDDVLEAYVKAVINPMIDSHELLWRKLGALPVDRSLHFKRFRSGMWVQFLPMAENNLRNKSASHIVLDEIDAALESLGDVYDQADQRRQTFGRDSKILAVSHPDQAIGLDPARWQRGIMRLYAMSNRCTWWWPCPQCGDYSSPNPNAARVMELDYPQDAPVDEIRDGARLICPSCGHPIEDKWRRPMNIEGRWVGLGQTIDPDGTIAGERVQRDVAGYWIVGAMSPFIIGGIGALAEAKVRAERDAEVSGDYKPLRTLMARRFGVPYEPRKAIGSVDAATLAERAEPLALGVVSVGVRFMTAFVDVQSARFEVLVRGWGVAGESWIIDVYRVAADTAVSPAAWDELLTALAAIAYPLTDGSRRAMRVRAIGYDSAGSAGVTQQAYAAWRRLRQKRQIAYYGKFDGRDTYNIMPVKGLSGPNPTRLQVVHPNSKRKDRDARSSGAEPLVLFSPNAYKDDLAGQLACAEPGPLMIHFPDRLRGNWPATPPNEAAPHVWFEQVVAEQADRRGRWSKIRENMSNEALDQLVGSHVIAELNGLSRIKWDRPPPWAAEWDVNSMIVSQDQAVIHTPATVSLISSATSMPPPPRDLRSLAQRLAARLAH